MSLEKDEVKYHMLRSLCDKHHYLQSMDYGSLSLIEAILNDLISLKHIHSRTKEDISLLKEKNENLILITKAYKQQNNDLFNENAELHKEIIDLIEQKNFKGKEIEMKRLNDDKNTIKFLYEESNEKYMKILKKYNKLKNKYLEVVSDIYDKKKYLNQIFDELDDDCLLNFEKKEFENYDNINDNSNNNEKKMSTTYKNSNNNGENTNNNFNNTNLYENNNNNNNNNSNNNNHSNNNNNNNSNNNNISSNMNTNPLNEFYTTSLKKTNKELYEKIYSLENELNAKNKELFLLKKNLATENMTEQKVVIDFLKKELNSTKEKYEYYLKYQMNKNKDEIKKNDIKHKKYINQLRNSNFIVKNNNIENNKNDIKIESKKRLEELKSTRLEKELNKLKEKYNNEVKKNKIQEDEIKVLIKQLNEKENYIQNELENELIQFNNRNQNKNDNEINLITSLSKKLNENESILNSTRINFKNSVNQLNKENIKLNKENLELKKQIQNFKDIENSYKDRINNLNKELFDVKNFNNKSNNNVENNLK